MNLKCYLLSRIVMIALLCLGVTAAYVLYQTDRLSRQQALTAADTLGRQLELQQLRIHAGFGEAQRFPDFDLWKQTGGAPGLCVRFLPVQDGTARGICHGANITTQTWPALFGDVYRWVFNPDLDVIRPVVFNGQRYGSLVVTPGAEPAMTHAWENIRNLLAFSAIIVPAIGMLIYVSISRILRPARLIVEGLEQMKKGDLSVRLPDFAVAEWQRTAIAINQLAASQQQLLAEHSKLAVRLMTIQDEERCYLARELHDELGQCLAAINAVAASITQTAEQDCPALVPEAQTVSRITGHIMATVRGLLLRLRPYELDVLGLSVSLESLVAKWNSHSGGKTRYQLVIDGDCGQLPATLPTVIFRSVQECLTNAAKHAHAAHVKVTLITGSEFVTLRIEDDGITADLPYPDNAGIGLLGIRERITTLAGHMRLTTIQPHGLSVHIHLPIPPRLTEARS
ncbi:MAG: histidine kinase [Methylovulum sp.]|nr:histidine kinase [Methylovulum sp.]